VIGRRRREHRRGCSDTEVAQIFNPPYRRLEGGKASLFGVVLEFHGSLNAPRQRLKSAIQPNRDY